MSTSPIQLAEFYAEWLESRLRGVDAVYPGPGSVQWFSAAHDIRLDHISRQRIRDLYPDCPAGFPPEKAFRFALAAQRSDPATAAVITSWLAEELAQESDRLLETLEQRTAAVFPWCRSQGVWASVDAVLPVGSKGWKIIRVFPSGKIRPAVVTQTALFYEGFCSAGAEHVEVEFRVNGKGKPGTRLVRARLGDMDMDAAGFSAAAGLPVRKGVSVRPRDLPVCHVSYLLRGKADRRSLLERGIMDIRAIPENEPMSQRQRNQRAALARNSVLGDAEAHRTWLSSIQLPIVFLDFESIQSSVPMFDDVAPWRYVPVMYSLADTQNREKYVCLPPASDDLTGFADTLAEFLDGYPTVGVFGAAMERECLGLLAACASPDAAAVLRAATSRIVDLHTPFEAGWIYYPEQRGKTSLKYLAPIANRSSGDYSRGEVSDGREASLQYYWQRYGYPDGTWPVRAVAARLQGQIETYSRLDTVNLHELWKMISCLTEA